MRAEWFDRLRWFAWITLLVTIPVTSFPFLPVDAFRNVVVRPLALYPLLFLVLLDLLPSLVRGEKLPKLSAPLLGFAVFAAVVTGLRLLEPQLAIRGITPGSRGIRGISTVAVGLSFFLVAVRMSASPEMLRRSLRWLYVGAGLSIALGALQAVRILTDWPAYEAFNRLHRWISVRDLHVHRVTGPSFEPSWFADYLVVLVLPFALGGLLAGSFVISKGKAARALGIALPALATAILLTTYSRGGLAALLISGAAVLLLGGGAILKRAFSWLLASETQDRRLLRRSLRIVAVGAASALILWGAVIILRQNDYFALLWIRLGRVDDPQQYLIAIGGGPRLAFAQAAWEVFQRFPWAGVGLGQSGFYLLDHIPNWALGREAEINDLMVPTSWLFPNPKNLWLRLLSETGIVGALLFGIFLLATQASSIFLLSHREPLARHAGLAGVAGGIAFFLEGFSLDSFALPAVWILFGMVTGALHAYLPEAVQAPEKAVPESQTGDGEGGPAVQAIPSG